MNSDNNSKRTSKKKKTVEKLFTFLLALAMTLTGILLSVLASPGYGYASASDASANEATSTGSRLVYPIFGDATFGDYFKPGDATLGDYLRPGDATFGDLFRPGSATPGDSTPSDATPSDPKPRDPKPGDSTPGDATPGDSTPTDATPTDATPTDASLTFTGTKTYNNTSSDGQFTFLVTEEIDGETVTVTTGENTEAGAISFGTITYTQDAVGEHTYTVSEVDLDLPGVTYDSAKYTLEVTVTENDNVLTAEITGWSYTDASGTTKGDGICPIEFNNTYTGSGGTTDPGLPPARDGSSLVEMGDNVYVEISEDGTPLGTWTYDDEDDEWIFDDEVPLGYATPLPQTGGVSPVLIITLALIGLLFLILGIVLRKRGSNGKSA